MPRIPRDSRFDSTLAMLREPYDFIRNRCRLHKCDVFETRLMLRKTICMMGPDAAEIFYDTRHFVRHGAAPGRLQKSLFGKGGVQTLDDDAHRERKQLLMTLLMPDRIANLCEMMAERWRHETRKWAAANRMELYQGVREILTCAVCRWAAIPLRETELPPRTAELTALFDGAGAVGPRHWRSRMARHRAEQWIRGIVESIRAGEYEPPVTSAAHGIACFRDRQGNLLPPEIATVELLNILRPVVAVAVYVVFIAHALHEHPEHRQRIAAGDAEFAELFVQEVRRHYPFFPAVIARVRDDFEWRGFAFPKGRQVILDLYGTNHDPRTWADPEEFRPERFRDWQPSATAFIPQGGGDFFTNHRCAGEWLTIEMMKLATAVLTHEIAYEVPAQDLRIDRSRLPALPASHFLIAKVRATSLGASDKFYSAA